MRSRACRICVESDESHRARGQRASHCRSAVAAVAFFTYLSSQLIVSATDVQVRLTRRVAVRLVRQRHVAHRRAVSLERHVEPLRLDRERARVVVRLAVNQEDRLIDLVGVPERRHLRVDLRNLPERSRLGLEAERRQRAVVGATSRHAGREEIGMREQIGRHERAVAVAADADAMRDRRCRSRRPCRLPPAALATSCST